MTSKEMNDDLDFEDKISSYSIRQLLEYNLRETRAFKSEIRTVKKDTANNCRKITIISFILVSLIIILITLGVIDGFFLELFSGLL